MNQILYTGNLEHDIPNYKKNISKNKKSAYIPMLSFVMPLTVLILVFSFNVYAKSSNESKSETIIADTNVIANVEQLPIIEESKEINNNDTNINGEPQQEIETDIKQETQKKNTNSTVYTTDNGESYTVIGKLNIPSLNIEYPILSSTSTALLKISLNKYWGANPNEVGNMVVVGHNYKNSKFFSKLPNIQIGAIVKITDTNGNTLNYTVYDTDVIDPYDNSCTSQLTDGYTEITLITCYNNGKQRFIAKARAN